jgi:hypothetical protein
MPESTGIAFGFVKFRYDLKSGHINFFNHHLGNPVSAPKPVRFAAEVNDSDFYFTPVIRIDGSG